MSMQTEIYKHDGVLVLENGEILEQPEIAFCAWGTLNKEANNVIYICHALTANADVADWWPGTTGKGLVFDTDKYYVVCANILGSCYGTTGAASINPKTNQPYGKGFPFISVRDMVSAHRLLVKHLNIRSIHLLCGGSLGGQQAMEWAIAEPDFVKQLFLIATNARHSAWGIAFNEAQRMALELGEKGLEAARAIAMLSYRNYHMYEKTQTDPEHKTDGFLAAGYQRYQGQKLSKRFNADSYYTLSKAMDSHNVGSGRGTVEQALSTIRAKTLVVGISSDILFPVSEQQLLAEYIPGATLKIIGSQYGHDGFLIETPTITQLLKETLDI